MIDGRQAELGDQLEGTEKITLDGRPLSIRGIGQPHRYILYNKPGDELTSRDDPEGRKLCLIVCRAFEVRVGSPSAASI